VELDGSGRTVRSFHVGLEWCSTFDVLPNGTGNQSGRHTIVEVDRLGKVLSEQPVQGRVFRIVGR
jgi:hypothetical protein